MNKRPDRAHTLSAKFDLEGLIRGLAGDLELLRKGKISVQDARARAELARQMLRGVHYVIQARKFLESSAKMIESSGERK